MDMLLLSFFLFLAAGETRKSDTSTTSDRMYTRVAYKIRSGFNEIRETRNRARLTRRTSLVLVSPLGTDDGARLGMAQKNAALNAPLDTTETRFKRVRGKVRGFLFLTLVAVLIRYANFHLHGKAEVQRWDLRRK